MNSVKIDCSQINTWKDFHDTFRSAFCFPAFYGENMNAWIDCMTCLDDEFSVVHVKEGDILTLELQNVKVFKSKCPDIYDALIECSAFVNYRRIDLGQMPILSLSFCE